MGEVTLLAGVTGSGWALAGAFFRLMYTGRVQPKSNLDKAERDNDKLHLALEAQGKTLGILVDQNRELTTMLRDINAAVLSPRTARRPRGSGTAS